MARRKQGAPSRKGPQAGPGGEDGKPEGSPVELIPATGEHDLGPHEPEQAAQDEARQLPGVSVELTLVAQACPLPWQLGVLADGVCGEAQGLQPPLHLTAWLQHGHELPSLLQLAVWSGSMGKVAGPVHQVRGVLGPSDSSFHSMP